MYCQHTARSSLRCSPPRRGKPLIWISAWTADANDSITRTYDKGERGQPWHNPLVTGKNSVRNHSQTQRSAHQYKAALSSAEKTGQIPCALRPSAWMRFPPCRRPSPDLRRRSLLCCFGPHSMLCPFSAGDRPGIPQDWSGETTEAITWRRRFPRALATIL